MSEQDAAEKFSREIDARLAGREANFPEDADAWSVAVRLAGANFAADTRVRESLRVTLSLRARRRSRRIFVATGAVTLAFAAMIFFVLEGRRPSLRSLRTAAPPTTAQSVIRSVPGGGPFVSVEGRSETASDRRAVVFELNGGVYRLETRQTSLDEIFVTLDPPRADEMEPRGGRS